MNDDLTTLAAYSSPIEANLARNRLEAAGIPAFLSGEESAAMAWPFGDPVGIKLHVASHDALRASACLAGADPATGGASGPTGPLADNTAITLQRGPEALEATGITDEPPMESVAEDDEEEPTFTEREQNAGRALRGAVLGILFLPLQFYVLYLLFKVYLSDEALSPRHQRYAWIAALFNVPVVLLQCLLLRVWLGD